MATDELFGAVSSSSSNSSSSNSSSAEEESDVEEGEGAAVTKEDSALPAAVLSPDAPRMVEADIGGMDDDVSQTSPIFFLTFYSGYRI